MQRVSLKIVGASGQGINSIGEVLAKGLKREGYCVFGYREYPSLIKGGHASYQLDVSDEHIASSEQSVHILVSLNHHGLQRNLAEVKDGGVIVHSVPSWKFSKEDTELLAARKIKVVHLPVEALLEKLKAAPILSNVLFSAFVWAALGQPMEALKAIVTERYAKKKALLDLNVQCLEEGFRYADPEVGAVSVKLPSPQEQWKEQMLLTGSHALALGAVHAGVRFYAGYPMTPSSPLLSYIAELQNRTGMAVKQAEDEITAAQMVSGAMLMGTRALTATSGGGFDLMTETFSLNGMLENPAVFVLAQRPGPATGLPTWTAQGDLLMAVHSAHGEFPRCVLAVGDGDDAFHLVAEAFNLAEEFQIPVIILTDKHHAEALYTQALFDQSKTKILRGSLVTAAEELAALKVTDRYDPALPVSKRWLPGSKAPTFCAQGDEHSPDGSTDESAENARAQAEKRLNKMAALTQRMPQPLVRGRVDEAECDLLVVSWGSNKGVIDDVLASDQLKSRKIVSLHYTHLWPLRTEELVARSKRAKSMVLVECNAQAQLGKLIRMECGLHIPDCILKADGRPFFFDELLEQLQQRLPAKTSSRSR